VSDEKRFEKLNSHSRFISLKDENIAQFIELYRVSKDINIGGI